MVPGVHFTSRFNTTKSGKEIELQALTMIHPATGWFEVKDVVSPSAAFDDVWLCRYPRPQYLGFGGGSEYKGVFNQMRLNYGLKSQKTTAYNPQANGVIERVHQVLNDCLRMYELEDEELKGRDPFRPFLAAAAFAIRSITRNTRQLVYGRDMLLPVKFTADWAAIQQRKQTETKRNNERENKSRIAHEYKVGDQILLTKPGKIRKHRAPHTGPYKIERVYSNGTIHIRRGQISDRVNLRRVIPYFN